MRSLLLFAIRFHTLLIFVFLEIVSLVLVFNYNSFQRATFLNSTEEMVGAVQETTSNITSFFSLGDVNKQLAAENARLRDSLQLISSWLPQQSRSYTQVVNTPTRQYELIPATVINSTYQKRNNYFTINKGAEDFVAEYSGVITRRGIVGIVRNTSRNYASGLSILHADASVSASIKDLNEVGSIQWDFEDHTLAKLVDIPRHVRASKGQEVVVSHLSFTFPEGTPIGEIVEVNLTKGAAYLDITVRLYEDIRNIKHVYVVNNLKAKEKEQLEAATEE